MSRTPADADNPTVVVTFDASPEQKAVIIETLAPDASLTFLDEVPPAQHLHAVEQADVLLAWGFPRDILALGASHLQHVRLIQFLSAGVDGMPLADLPSDVLIASNAGAYAVPMAEHVLAMTLALAKHLLVEDRKLQQGQFDQRTPNRLLAGATAGILGFGGIGIATARLMRAFGMRVYAINTSGTSPEPTDFIGTLRDLEHVLRESDVVVVSLPLTKDTRGLIGEEQLGWMKPDGILVNVARGAIVDEGALYKHARSDPTFLVGIDTWWTEPSFQRPFRMKYPFLDLPNVVGSPHNSANVADTLARAARHAAENVKRFLDGERVAGIIRREDYV